MMICAEGNPKEVTLYGEIPRAVPKYKIWVAKMGNHSVWIEQVAPMWSVNVVVVLAAVLGMLLGILLF